MEKNDTHIIIENFGKKEKDKEIVENIQEFLIIDNFYIQPLKDEKPIVSNFQIEKILSSLADSLTPKEKRLIDIRVDEQILAFKKADLNEKNFPCLQSFMKEFIKKTIFETKSRISTLYYIFGLIERSSCLEEKMYDFYLKIIKKSGYGISTSMKHNITREVKLSNEYSDFIGKLAEWYASTEMSMFNFHLLHFVFGIHFEFDKNKFSIGKNSDWGINSFAKKNFMRLCSLMLRNADLGVKLFGSINYASVAFMMMSGYYGGMSIPSIFWSKNFSKYVMIGSFVFNYVVTKVTGYLDNYSNTFEYEKMSDLLVNLNSKLSNISKSSSELLKLLIISELHLVVEQIEIKSETKKLDREEKEKQTYERLYQNKLLEAKLDEVKLKIDRYLARVDDISNRELIEIEVQTLKWIEEYVVIETEDCDSYNCLNHKNENEKEKLNDNESLNANDNVEENKNESFNANETKTKSSEPDKWVLINVIKTNKK